MVCITCFPRISSGSPVTLTTINWLLKMNEISEAPQRNFASWHIFGTVCCFANTKRTNVNFRGIMRFVHRVMINLGTDFLKRDEWAFLLYNSACFLFLSALQFFSARFPQCWQINPLLAGWLQTIYFSESDTLPLLNSFCVFFFCIRCTWLLSIDPLCYNPTLAKYTYAQSVVLSNQFSLSRIAVNPEAILRHDVSVLTMRITIYCT